MSNENTGHPHWKVMKEFVEVAETNKKPWEEFQYLLINKHGWDDWRDLPGMPLWCPEQLYRRKPKIERKMQIGENIVEAYPLTEEPDIGFDYFYIDEGDDFQFVVGKSRWENYDFER